MNIVSLALELSAHMLGHLPLTRFIALPFGGGMSVTGIVILQARPWHISVYV